MRDIIFRAKRTDNGEWVEGRNISAYENPNTEKREFYIVQSGTGFAAMFDNDTGNITTIVFANTDNCMQKVDPETVGQFTGLTDKNGKKIFEGDVVMIPGSKMMGLPAPVDYNNQGAVFHIRRKGFQPITLWDASESVVVIGNIHDNPELLEG